MASAGRWAVLAVIVCAARFAHSGIIWVEEAYPGSAAVQMLHGAVPYRDFFYDKPPLSAAIYVLWGAWPGVASRLAASLYVLLCAWLAHRLAGGWAGALMAFFLTFYVPAAVIPLAPDLLLAAPHLAAMVLAREGRPFVAGAMAGLGLLIHVKAVFVAPVLILWCPAGVLRVIAGFAGVTAASLALLAAAGALQGYWDQVWVWGRGYAADPLYEAPVREGLMRTLNWLGFHAAAVVGGLAAIRRDWKLAAWFGIALAGALLGARFAPRYYFLPLVPLVAAAARGPALWMAVLALIPLVRFGPRYVQVAAEGGANWADTAMARDSHAAAARILERSTPADTLFVWGYRPEILWETRLRLGAPFLDSQPLTGVLADRHLRDSRPTFAALGARNRARLVALRPTFVVDGLGPYNRELAITTYPELARWIGENYQEIARTPGCIVYRLR
ncbi:MAG: hypothetical protein FJW39_06345 [Acidobacteria bacterium]|nr:hypothetical protein [Acidobacteriota bacterium]